ncbi:aminotransferase class I/II-fold pyridoxal phosphate-dependent enzyme [Auritidibacter ignavus]|uniref:Aminotransferase n=1 Tax=Auritidibacter ignavus TaxID=678932 RepID=A0AAJ6DC95_9MICC|nr:aminotransferase class I/II-fold pyridoxal phosphate-dependent enzyme [Auritidibacter ignavus]WGH92577.1 aminotransferase class I/II-fold pyridoxal phosphate-dependent enzyme [Auritidibacter ignavus]
MTDKVTSSRSEQPHFTPSRRSQVPPFRVMTILQRVAELTATGQPVISLCAGEPSGGAPTAVTEAARNIHDAAVPLNYTPSLGIQPLREAIAEHYRRWYDLEVPVSQVAVTTGSSGGFMVGFLAAFDVGDRVGLARPGYAAYRNVLQALGCEVVEIPAGAEQGFLPSIRDLEQANVTGLVLASPNNPTGTMVEPASMQQLTSWCDAHGVRLFSDEIYHGITYSTRGVSSWEYSRTGVVVSSFSKYWGMPGWRLGWLLLPEDLVAPVSALSGSVSLCPPAAGQYAAVEAFSDTAYAECDARVSQFAATRSLILSRTSELGFDDAAPADGAFYYYARPPKAVMQRFGTATAYAQALLESHYVALTPGLDFDPVDGDEFIRISFAAGTAAVSEALERIQHFHAQNS